MNDASPSFKDHFSGHARDYAKARPSYPQALFAELARLSPARDYAWDCATGNGQAAILLASHFARVIATDASAAQIESASSHARVDYRVVVAERPQLDDASVDLITVAQALHWFDIEAFFVAAAEALRPRGILAYWCYGRCSIAPEFDAIVDAFYHRLDAYWPPERDVVERGYRDVSPPFAALELPDYCMQVTWSVEQMLAYLRTWSAYQRAVAATGSDPLTDFATALKAKWGAEQRAVRWPIQLTVCRKPADGCSA